MDWEAISDELMLYPPNGYMRVAAVHIYRRGPRYKGGNYMKRRVIVLANLAHHKSDTHGMSHGELNRIYDVHCTRSGDFERRHYPYYQEWKKP